MFVLRLCFSVILTSTLLVLRQSEASCVKAKRCCQGKDVTCVVQGERIKGIWEGHGKGRNGTCFCDSGCIDIGDCCTDYRDQCKSVDCVLEENWQNWGPCDSSCGLGTRQRVRRIVQSPMNGGKPCGKTVQRSFCEGTRCKLPRASGTVEEMREIGKILPVSFGGWRENKMYNPYKDVRQSLFLHHDNPFLDRPINDRPSYCATFDITEVRPGCQLQVENHLWTNLTKGSSLCIECQPMAMQKKLGGRCNGHGVYLRETRWTAVGVPGCHGTWLMKSRRKDCECSNHGSSFILV